MASGWRQDHATGAGLREKLAIHGAYAIARNTALLLMTMANVANVVVAPRWRKMIVLMIGWSPLDWALAANLSKSARLINVNR